MAKSAVKLPPGFELDDGTSASPSTNLPPGFELDVPVKKREASWSDVPANAVKDVKDMATGIGGTAAKVFMLPSEITQAGIDVVSGKSPGDTELGRDVRSMGQAIANTPGELYRQTKEEIGHPVRYFKEHPVNMALDVASVALPLAKGVTGVNLAEKAAAGMSDAARTVGEDAGRRAFGFSKGIMKRLNILPEDARQVAKIMHDNGVIEAFSDSEKLLENVGNLQEKTGKNISQFLKDRGVGFNPQSAIDELEKMRPEFKGGAYDASHAKIDRAIDTIKAHGDGPISFEEANKLKGTLQDLANYNSNKDATLLDKEIAGRFRNTLDKAIAGSSPNGGAGVDEFLNEKKTYGATKKAETALEDKVRMAGNRKIGLTDMILAGGGVAHGALTSPIEALKTLALIATKKGVEKYGWSTLSAVSNSLADMVGKQYAKVLVDAAEKGPRTLSAAHLILQETNPEYLNLFEKSPQSTPLKVAGESKKSTETRHGNLSASEPQSTALTPDLTAYRQGLEDFVNDDISSAEKYFNQALKINPNMVEAQRALDRIRKKRESR